MSISIKKDAWQIKDQNGNYRSTALFSTMLPNEAQQLIIDTRAEFTNLESETNEIIRDLENVKQEILDLEDDAKASIISTRTIQNNLITTLANKEIQNIYTKGQETLASIPQNYVDLANLANLANQTANAAFIYNSISDNIINFDDGVNGMLIKSLVANIEPTQDLHGYDHPWSGGSGKNKLPVVRTNTTISGVTFTWTDDGVLHLSGTPSASFRYDLNGGNPFTLPAGTYYLSGKNIPASTGTNWYLALRSYPESSAGNVVVANMNGASVQFTVSTDTEFYPVVFLNNNKVDTAGGVFEPMIRLASETDDTYEPYENECHISGHTSVTVSHSEADTSNPETLTIVWPDSINTPETFLSGDATDTYRGITIEKQYNELIINGTATGNARFKVSNTMAHAVSVQDSWLTETIDIPNGPKKLIIEIVSGEVTSGAIHCALYNSNGETIFVNATNTSTTEPKSIITFEKNNNAACVAVYCPANTSVSNLHLRFTVFNPCVYGGNIDVISGKLLITLAGKHFSDLTWTKNANLIYGFNGSGFPDRKKHILSYDNPDCYCDTYPWYNANDPNGLSNDISSGIALSNSNNDIYTYVVDSRFSTVEELTASFTTHDPFFVCPLEEPILIQLTPQEVECFLGVNNIWADTGDVTVTYPVDTKTYIDKKIQEAISGLSGS